MKRLRRTWIGMSAALALFSASASANLIVNGGFELSSSPTTTPTGWTNIGHSDGVITYANFGTPAYEGLNFYDLGGFGDAYGPTGDGIKQDIATVVGAMYRLDFGLSSENQSGDQELTVCLDTFCTAYALTVDGTGVFKKPFVTQVLNFTAIDALTTISFIATIGGGTNDAMIDKVIFELVADAAVPAPATLALFGLGLAGLGCSRRKKA